MSPKTLLILAPLVAVACDGSSPSAVGSYASGTPDAIAPEGGAAAQGVDAGASTTPSSSLGKERAGSSSGDNMDGGTGGSGVLSPTSQSGGKRDASVSDADPSAQVHDASVGEASTEAPDPGDVELILPPEPPPAPPMPGQPTAEDRQRAAEVAEPVAREDFCSTLRLTLCDGIQDCCSDDAKRYADRTDCLASMEVECDLNAYYEFTYETPEDPSGWTSAHDGYKRPAQYDPAAGGVELELLRERTTLCEIPYDWDLSALFPEGTFNDHIDCSTGLGCPENMYCSGSGDAIECVLSEPLGATCGACFGDAICGGRVYGDFVDDDNNPATDSVSDSLGNSTYGSDGASAGTCQLPDPAGCRHGECPLGMMCFGTRPVASAVGWSYGRCVPTRSLPEGAECYNSKQCAGGICSVQFEPNDWHRRAALGETLPDVIGTCLPCIETEGWECVDGLRIQKVKPVQLAADGGSCNTSADCQSGWCSSQVCLTPTPDELYCLPSVEGQ